MKRRTERSRRGKTKRSDGGKVKEIRDGGMKPETWEQIKTN